jgi:iron-sulfur cluster assembly protein
VKVFVKKSDLLFLDGSTLDFERKGLNELFKVENPKAAATCGCGEIFTIEDNN